MESTFGPFYWTFVILSQLLSGFFFLSVLQFYNQLTEHETLTQSLQYFWYLSLFSVFICICINSVVLNSGLSKHNKVKKKKNQTFDAKKGQTVTYILIIPFLNISNPFTGGCCFKPQTVKDGLKLFEIETVLSLEQRKPKKKLDPSSITEVCLVCFKRKSDHSLTSYMAVIWLLYFFHVLQGILKSMFTTRGYDEYPETSLPSQINSKVTVTER